MKNNKPRHLKKQPMLTKKIVSITVAVSLLFLMVPVSFAEIQAIPERQANVCHEAHGSCSHHSCCDDHACSHTHAGIATAEANEAIKDHCYNEVKDDCNEVKDDCNKEEEIIRDSATDEEVVNKDSSCSENDEEQVDKSDKTEAKKVVAYNLSEIYEEECYWTGEGKFEDGKYYPANWFDSANWTTSGDERVPGPLDLVRFGYDDDYEEFFQGDSTIRISKDKGRILTIMLDVMCLYGNVNVILYARSSQPVTIVLDDIDIDDEEGSPSLYLGNNVTIKSTKSYFKEYFKNEVKSEKQTDNYYYYTAEQTQKEYNCSNSEIDWHNPDDWDEATGYIPWFSDTAFINDNTRIHFNTDAYINQLATESYITFTSNSNRPCFFVLESEEPFVCPENSINIESDNIYFKVKCEDVDDVIKYFVQSSKKIDYLYDDPDGYKIIGVGTPGPGPEPTHKHDYRYQYTVDPTCSTGGYDVLKCTNEDGRCLAQEIKANYTDPTGVHTFINYRVTTEPSCMSEGIERGECKDCGAIDERTIEKTDHIYGQTEIENYEDATCLAEGSYDEVVYCLECNTELYRNTFIIEKKDHTPGPIEKEAEIEPTCYSEGSYEEIVLCAVCDNVISIDKKTIPKLDHKSGEPVREYEVPASCAEPGSYEEVVYCSACGEELRRETIEIEKVPHVSGASIRENEIPATCSAPGSYDEVVYCSECGEALSRNPREIPTLPHNPGESVWENIIEATCTATGSYDLVIRCTECDEILESDSHILDRVPHKEGDSQIENYIDATCTTDGSYDEVRYCTVCNEMLSSTTFSIPATGHTAGEASMEDMEEATCSHEGHYSMVTRCTVCNTELYRETVTTEKLQHSPGTPVKENEIEPTPTEDGSYDEVVYCSACNAELSRKTIIVPHPVQHNPGTAVKENVVESSCTQAGHYDLVTYCVDCGIELNREFIETDILPHNPGKVVQENYVEATCVDEGGYDEVTYCSECNEKIKSEHKTIAAKGHIAKAPERENEVDSSCTIAGHYDLVTRCSVCDEILESEYHTKELAEHVLGDEHRQNVINATCTEDGSYDEVFYCVNCNEEIQRTPKTIEAYGHTPGEPVKTNEVDSTCSEAGHYDMITRCSVCNAELEKETITKALLPHTPGAIQKENIVNPTCTEDGSYEAVKYCTKCDTEISRETKPIKALGHTSGEPVKENETDSTCTTRGKYDLVKYCQECQAELSRETFSKELLPHTPGEVVVENYVNPTCEEQGSYDEVTYCTVCNVETSRNGQTIAATGHNWKETFDTDENGHWHSCTKCDAIKDKGDHVYPDASVDHYICTECIYNNIPGAKKDTCDAFDAAAGENPSPVVAQYVQSLKDQVNSLNLLQSILNLQKSGVQDIENLKTDEEVAKTFDTLAKALPDVTDDTNIGNVENAFNYVKDAYDLLTSSQKEKITTDSIFKSKYLAFQDMQAKIAYKIIEVEEELDSLAGVNPSDEMKEILANYKEQLESVMTYNDIAPIAEESKAAIITQKTDEEGAAKADQLIEEIGNIDKTSDTAVVSPKVQAARAAFNALSDHAKYLVTKSDVLKQQESNLQELEAEIEKAKEEARAEIEKQAGPEDQRTPEMKALVAKKLAELDEQTSLAKVEKVKEEVIKEIKEQAEKDKQTPAPQPDEGQSSSSDSAKTSDSLAYALMVLSMLALAGGVVATRRAKYNN
ncbi:MAG: hypothetical protein Q4E88_06030 [Coriobacteriia bacterium]|nr:hypothetical protein [Coriobacteriia bacterium]